MSVVAEFAVPHEQFGLADVFIENPGLVLEVERMVAQPADGRMRYVWAIGAQRDIERALADAQTTTDVSVQSDGKSGTLFEIQWTDAVIDPISGVLEHDASIQTLVGQEAGWTMELRVPVRETLSEIQTYFDRCDADIRLQRLYAVDASSFDGRFILTPKQREALLAAERRGYYDIPRSTTMTELGEFLGVSQQAVSKRLRRGHARLIRHLLERQSASPDDETESRD